MTPGRFLKKSIGDLAVVLTTSTVIAAAVSTTVVAATVSTASATTAVAASAASAASAAVSTASTASTTISASATTAAVSTFTAGRTLLHRAGFVDGEVAAAHVGAAECCDRGLTLFGGAESNESESAGAAGDAVHHDDSVGDGAVSAEDLAEVGVGC